LQSKQGVEFIVAAVDEATAQQLEDFEVPITVVMAKSGWLLVVPADLSRPDLMEHPQPHRLSKTQKFHCLDDTQTVLIFRVSAALDTAFSMKSFECLFDLGCAGRAAALNAGAKAAKGQVLLFLHADSTLPRYWDLEVGLNVT
jgi:hypothetical protein